MQIGLPHDNIVSNDIRTLPPDIITCVGYKASVYRAMIE